MNARVSKVLLIPAIALALSACASVQGLSGSSFESEADRVAQIHPGLTQEAVRSLAGSPASVTLPSRDGERMWTYPFTDQWGYDSEFDVTFDANGIVKDTFSDRLDY